METDYISREANGDDFVRRADIVEKFMDRLPSISVGYLCKVADEIPAADVRPVVLCRDCIHRPYETVPGVRYGLTVKSPDSVYKCPCYCDGDGWYSYIPDDDFFCANGERLREGGTP